MGDPGERDRPRTRLWVKIALAFGTTVLCLAALEALARIEVARENAALIDAALHGRDLPPPGGVLSLGDALIPSENDRIAYALRPGLDGVARGYRIRTNRHGFRSEALPIEEPPGTVTVLGIGDSLQFGHGVERPEIYLERLIGAIRATHPAAAWRLVNTAVPGYNTVMEVETLERSGLAFSPDLVIVGVCGNDYAPPKHVREAIDPWRLDRCFLVHAVQERLARRDRPPGEGPGGAPIQAIVDRTRYERRTGRFVPDRYADLHGPEAFRRAVARLAVLSERHGFRLLAFACNDYPQAPEMMEVFREHGIETLHLQPRLEAALEADTGEAFSWEGYARSDLVVGGGNTHPSSRQHRMAAELLLARLTELRWLDELATSAR